MVAQRSFHAGSTACTRAPERVTYTVEASFTTRGITGMSTNYEPRAPEIKLGQPCYVRDLELTPDLRHEIETLCRLQRYWRARDRQWVEDEMKLQYYFGGLDIAYLVTPNGPAVAAAGTFGTEAFVRLLNALSPSDRRAVIFYCPDPWPDQNGITETSIPAHEV